MSQRHARVQAAAKINTCLEVLGRRADGFHELETVFQQIALYDQLTLEESSETGTRITYTNVDYDFGHEDICWRAVEALRPHVPGMPGISVKIEKHIPVAAGLGGASSDAAAILRVLAQWYAIERQVCQMTALDLGSDVPFFLNGGRAYARGRGEQLQPLPAAAQAQCFLLLSDCALQTADVFAALSDEERGPRPALGQEICQQHLSNRLTAAARRLRPQLDQLFNAAVERDIDIHLSGSGSACFSFDPRCRELPLSSILTLALLNKSPGVRWHDGAGDG